jgi:hypothetical protein
MPVRLIRNIMNRFWGGSGAAASTEDTTSEDDDDADRPFDDGGVD